ncbi:hypothetical protein SAMN05421538_107143 [Paracoccus isoporae]|uniref:CVNH domain-containing protein n=1 Tax=Paracoccus isoporae TaxID=591205 RepID=A0A1G7DLE1_9RHOB|nr:DUF6636 domain-containing protein [Paracoccus isoporae]SDE52364.1 hypothetical protein SAMN05421538_107143 [Paracoccus isoporae]
MKTILALGFVAAATAASADGYGFRTPSGNIYCNGSVEADEILCSIVERSGPPAAPDSGACPAVWGHHVRLDRNGPAQIICGPPPRKSSYSDVADYGVSARFGQIACRSEKTGLQCENPAGHGFLLSRAAQRIW